MTRGRWTACLKDKENLDALDYLYFLEFLEHLGNLVNLADLAKTPHATSTPFPTPLQVCPTCHTSLVEHLRMVAQGDASHFVGRKSVTTCGLH